RRGETFGQFAGGVLRDPDFARASLRGQPRGEVHRVADHRVLHVSGAADVGADHRPGGDADADLQLARLGEAAGPVHARYFGLERDRAAAGAGGVVGLIDRAVEDDDHRVADELVQVTVVLVD